MPATLRFKVNGRKYDGVQHRIHLSFGESFDWFFVDRNVSIHVACEDETGTNDYIIVSITAETRAAVLREMYGQANDGLLENVRYGNIALMSDGGSDDGGAWWKEVEVGK